MMSTVEGGPSKRWVAFYNVLYRSAIMTTSGTGPEPGEIPCLS